MTLNTKPFSYDAHIDTPEDAVRYIEAALDEVGPEHLKSALLGIAHSKGMTLLAEKSGLSRAGLYRALSEQGDPKLSTVFAILKALGLRMTLQPLDETAA